MEGALSEFIILLRAIQFAASLVLLGTVTFLILLQRQAGIAPRDVPVDVLSPYVRLAAWSLAITISTLIVWLFMQTHAMAGELSPHWLAMVSLHTQFGQVMLWRLGLLLLVALLLVLRMRRGRLNLIAALAAAAALGLLVCVGHVAAAVPTPWLQVYAQIIHLFALGVWIGGLPAFMLVLAPASIDNNKRAVAATVSIIHAFSRVCVVCAVVVVITGISNATYFLHSPVDFIHTNYGELLLAKIGVLSLLLIFAASNLLQLRPTLEGAVRDTNVDETLTSTYLLRMRRNVRIEAILSMVILVLVGALGVVMPPM